MPDAPPPEVADDCPRDADRRCRRTAHEEVHRHEDVREVLRGDGDESEEGRLRPRWSERGGHVGERDEECACVHIGAKGDVEGLTYGVGELVRTL